MLKSSELWTSILYICIGSLFLLFSLEYNAGTWSRPGAGAFPLVISALLIAVGVGLLLRSFVNAGPPIQPFDLTSVVSVGSALLVAGLSMRTFGLAVAVPAAVAISSLASGTFRPVRIMVMSIVLTAFCYAVFVLGLKINIPFLPGQE